MLYSWLWKSVNDINILKVWTSPTFSQHVGREPEEIFVKETKRTRNVKKINVIICVYNRRSPNS